MKQRICNGCGEPLVQSRSNQYYHDKRCRNIAYRARGTIKKPRLSSPPLIVLAGVDTLYVNAYYADPELFTRIEQPLDETLQATFTDLQQRAKVTHQDIETPWSLEEKPLHMLSHGSGKQWLWILRNDLINVQIGNGDYKGVIAHLRISSDYLWRVNALHTVLGLVNGLANRLFAHETVLVPSAIDLCADIADWPMTCIDPLALVASARKRRKQFEEESVYISGREAWNGRKLGTLYVGMRTSPVHGKLYDKLKEIKDGGNKKSWFLDLYKRNGWDGEAPVTRLEISFTREALHDLDIETDFDLMHNLKGLWGYAVGSETVKPWLRYTIPTGDSNQTRWPLHPTWSMVQHAFDALSEQPAKELIRIKKQEANIAAATASLAGYLSSQTVWKCDRDGVAVEDIELDKVIIDLYDDVEKRLQEKGVSFQEVLQTKQKRYYLRKAQTREVIMRRVNATLQDDQEAM
jgi:hypothetical protein